MFLGRETAQLTKMAQAHRILIKHAQSLNSIQGANEVISLGAEVTAHVIATAELRSQNRVLDLVVTEELDSEHRRLADDLCLLETLNDTNPESVDVKTLSSALLDRIQTLLEREQRMIYRPLLRLATNLEETP